MSRVRVGILSAGDWSRQTHIPAVLDNPEAELVVVTSPDPANAQAIAQSVGITEWRQDWRDALDLELDAVVVSSPPVAHESQVLEALDRGLHVLVEKPMALDGPAAHHMALRARDRGRCLLVGLGWSQTSLFRQARARVLDGQLGCIEHASVTLEVNVRRLLVGEEPEAVSPTQRSTYRSPDVSGGGAASVSMSHQLGLLVHLVGEPVTAVCAATYPARGRLDLHDAVVARLHGGGVAALSCTSAHPYDAPPRWRVVLTGDRGQLTADNEGGRLLMVHQDGRIEESYSPDGGVYRAGAPTDALVAAALGAPVPDGLRAELGAHVVDVTSVIYASAAGSRWVQVTGGPRTATT